MPVLSDELSGISSEGNRSGQYMVPLSTIMVQYTGLLPQAYDLAALGFMELEL